MPVVTDIQARWEKGVDHHPESLQLMQELKHVDKLNKYPGGDLLETGGDGDTGETLMYLLDVVFELREQAKKGKSHGNEHTRAGSKARRR